MTIETSSAPQSAPKAGSTTDARGSKSAAKAGAAGAPATGFMAVLAALDDQGSAPGPAVGLDEDKNTAVAPVDVAQAATNVIANAALPTDVPVAATSADALGGLPAAVVPALATDTRPADSGRPANPRAAAGGALAGLEAGTAGDASKDLAAIPGATKAKQAAGATGSLAEGKSSPVQADAAKLQDAKFMATLEAMKVLQGGGESPTTAPASSGAAPVPTVERSTSERLQMREQDTGGQYTPQFSSMGTTSYASASVQDPGAVSSEMYVAQQVSYWISQDVQNAELTLDGLGMNPVEVSISMSGNEAHIAFRSDETQTLSVLDGATAHLKEMLREQGLVLSGVSVGTSGSGEGGDGERRQRQGARQQSATVPVAATETRRTSVGSSGRTLDLFV